MKKIISILIAVCLMMTSSIAYAFSYQKSGLTRREHSIEYLRSQLKKFYKDKEKRDELISLIAKYYKDKDRDDDKDEEDEEDLMIFIDGEEIDWKGSQVIKHDKILIPVKPIINGLGAQLAWNERTKIATITKGDIKIVINLKEKVITVNGREVKPNILIKSKNKNKSIALFKFIAEVLGRKTDTDYDDYVAIIDDEDIISINDNTIGTGLNQFEYSGEWAYSRQTGAYEGDNHWSNKKNSFYQIRFTGTQIKVYGSRASSYGIAAVSIDGGPEKMVDLYSARRVDNVLLYQSSDLPNGQHIIKVRLTGTKNKKSTNYYVAADRVEVHGADPTSDKAGTGLRGEYFNNKNFTDCKLTRVDGTINFNWGLGSPVPAIDADTFSVRWTGKIEPLHSEEYTFYTVSDDGVRLWVNGTKIIDNWNDHSAVENKGTIALRAGQKYDIKLEYYDNTKNAVLKLLWSSESQAKQIIPKTQLYAYDNSDTSPPTVPANLIAAAVSPNQVNLSWTASADNVGVLGYKVYRNNEHIATVVDGTTYSDLGLEAETVYVYAVSAIDRTGNTSGKSPIAVVVTPADSPVNAALNKTASSDSNLEGYGASNANDGNTSTSWYAEDGKINHWWKVDLGSSYNLNGTEIIWPLSNKVYKYMIEVSADNTNWTVQVNKTNNTSSGQTQKDNFSANSVRYVRVTITGLDAGCWAGMSEIKVFGKPTATT